MDKKNKTSLNFNIVSFSTMASPDNDDSMKFSGIIGYVDTPSDMPPHSDYKGYRAVLSSDNVDIDSLVGSGVNVLWSADSDRLTDHSVRFKVGVIDKAWLDGKEIHADGHLWKVDFPDVCSTISLAKDSLGFSAEAIGYGITKDDNEKILKMENVHFTGVSILYKDRAAFQKTSIMCSISKENKNLTEEMKKALDEQNKANEAKFSALDEKLTKLTETVAQFSAAKKEEKKPEAPKEKEEKVDIAKAISDGIAAAFAAQAAQAKATEVAEVNEKKVEEPARKTKTEFASDKQLDNKEKTAVQLSSEIDADPNLSADEKWCKQLELWQKHRDEFTK